MIDYKVYLTVIGTLGMWLLILFGLVKCKRIIKENFIGISYLAPPILVINYTYFSSTIFFLIALGSLNHDIILSVFIISGISYLGLLSILLSILKHITKESTIEQEKAIPNVKPNASKTVDS